MSEEKSTIAQGTYCVLGDNMTGCALGMAVTLEEILPDLEKDDLVFVVLETWRNDLKAGAVIFPSKVKEAHAATLVLFKDLHAPSIFFHQGTVWELTRPAKQRRAIMENGFAKEHYPKGAFAPEEYKDFDADEPVWRIKATTLTTPD
jgi:hypothetical protein